MKNKTAIELAAKTVLAAFQKKNALTPIDPGVYKTVKVYGVLKFQVEQYQLEGVGNLSVMGMKLGPMAMSTVVATPFEKNAPLLSVDLICMAKSRKLIVECYDLTAEKDEEYNKVLESLAEAVKCDLPSYTPDPAWYADLLTVTAYKSCKADDDSKLLELLKRTAETWIDVCSQLPQLDDQAKTEKLRLTREYARGLVDKGGVSTDVFKKALGVDTTKDFFGKVFFGTER